MGAADFEIRSGWLALSAVASVVVVVGALLSAVSQSRDARTAQWIAAERACAHYHYRAERETCMAQWLARSRAYMPLKR